jgi:hypothetical protein
MNTTVVLIVLIACLTVLVIMGRVEVPPSLIDTLATSALTFGAGLVLRRPDALSRALGVPPAEGGDK